MLPTPTAMPPGAPMVTLNAGDYRIWQFTDEAIQVWNYEPNLGLMFQVGILIVIVVVFVVIIIGLVQSMTEQE